MFLTRKIVITHMMLAQNFREDNADFMYIRYVYLILISKF
jgi:hypothetical protein